MSLTSREGIGLEVNPFGFSLRGGKFLHSYDAIPLFIGWDESVGRIATWIAC
jgi:hypothetical protein